jgi:uncharacterized protein
MGRLLVLIVLVVAAVWLVRRALRPRGAGAKAPEMAKADDLVRCAHCSVLLPRAEARQAEGGLYCGEEHARRGPAR